MNETACLKLKSLLESSPKSILLVAHKAPDLDAIGSILAMYQQLIRLNHQVHIWSSDCLLTDFSWLPESTHIQTNLPKTPFDTLMVLDSSNLERVSDYEKLDLSNKTIINIDHHADNNQFGDINITGPISSVGERLCNLFTSYNWPITPAIATCLYAAILYDTGRFLFSNTTAKTLKEASQLIEKGADAYAIGQHIYENKSEASFECLKIALNNMCFNKENSYVYTILPKTIEQKEKTIDTIRQLKEADIAIVFHEQDNNVVKINLRSKHMFNVSKFAAHFGGGGHPKASGITMTGTLEDVRDNVLAQLDKALNTTQV